MKMIKLKKVLKENYYLLRNKLRSFRRINLKNKDFTILSNDCSGGFVYQYFGLPYISPTAGLFFTSQDFLKLVTNPMDYFSKGLIFIKPDEAWNYNQIESTNQFGKYPIARLFDIEVYFMHYETQNEAARAWYRRVSRINYDNIILLLTENRFFNQEILNRYANLPNLQKVCLTYSSKYGQYPFVFYSGESNFKKIKFWSPKLVAKSLDWKKKLNEWERLRRN